MLKSTIKNIAKNLLFKKSYISKSNAKEANQALHTEELRNDVRNLEFEPGESEAQKRWIENQEQLKHLILSENVENFLQWEVIKSTMGVEQALYIFKEYKFLKSLPDFETKWKNYLKESSVGNPSCFKNLSGSSSTLVHHAYHLALWERNLNESVTGKSLILEFGGGYGSMCRLIHNMGFKNKYVIFDLPIFSRLQTYYLKSLNLPVVNFEEFMQNESGILCTSDLEILNKVIQSTNNLTDSLFIATWSLSETSIETREPFDSILEKFSSFLIAYQPGFGEVNNEKYFKNFQNQFTNVGWKTLDIQHYEGNHKYLLGSVKA